MAPTTVSGLPTIGDVILAWRKFRGLTSTQLVKKAEIPKGYLSALEHNKKKNPQEEFLMKLAAALEVPLEDILGRHMPPEEGKEAGTTNSQQGGAQGNQSTVLHTPLATKRQKILMHRIAVLEKKLEALEKNLRTVQEEVREIGSLATDIFREEESDAPTL